MGIIDMNDEQYYLGPDGVWDSWDENYGNYQFTSIKDIVNNFIISYVGESKIISKVKRTDVAFHAQRAIQEFSYDVLPSVKAQEIEIGPSLNFILPIDYVNYVKVTWMDGRGIERIVYPAIKTSNPGQPILQDNNEEYLFDEQNRENLLAEDSRTKTTFQKTGGNSSEDRLDNRGNHFGQRFGLTPENAQSNGVFYIDQTKGIINFDSSFVGRIVTLKYISDGLGDSEELTVHKFAEEALYKYIAHAILATRANTPEYLVMRFKKEAAAAKRNSKLRLSNIKIEEIAQVMRNKSKQIKH
jgi:hypothetical protein